MILPTNLKWLEFEGRKIFPATGADGSPSSYLYAVLIDHVEPRYMGMSFGSRAGLYDAEGGKWYVIKLPYDASPERFEEETRKAIEALK